MKNVLVMLMVLTCIGFAQREFEKGKVAVGVAGELAIPLGDFGTAAKLGFGGTAHVQIATSEMFAITLSSGYLRWSGETFDILGVDVSTDFSAIPVMAGGKVLLGNSGLYFRGESGIHIFRVSAETAVVDPFSGNTTKVSASATETKFSASPELGFEAKTGESSTVQIAGRFNYVTDSLSYIGVRIGLLFGS